MAFAAMALPTARRAQCTEAAGNSGVGGDPARGNAQQRLPHLDLEIGAFHQHGQRRLPLCVRVEDARSHRSGELRRVLDARVFP